MERRPKPSDPTSSLRLPAIERQRERGNSTPDCDDASEPAAFDNVTGLSLKLPYAVSRARDVYVRAYHIGHFVSHSLTSICGSRDTMRRAENRASAAEPGCACSISVFEVEIRLRHRLIAM